MHSSLFGKTWAWPFKFIRQMLHKHTRYVFLRPPMFEQQVLLDKKNRTKLTLATRDRIDFAVIKHLFSKQDYDLTILRRWNDIHARYKEILASGNTPLIIDAGANIGASTLYFANEFPDAHVVGIEPEPGNFELASQNCQSVSNISLMQAGLANTSGKAAIHNPGADSWAFQTQIDEQGDLALISVTDILTDAPAKKQIPFIIKIDIEGFEQNVFEAQTEWINAFYVLVIELHDWMLPGKANSQNFLSSIAPLGRDFVYRNENVFSVKN